jgi:hypothetical protein
MGMKEEFAKGCREGGGSFVENADGTFQCNTRSGLTIKCQEDGNRCWVAAEIAPEVHISVGVEAAGIKALLELPAPTPTKPGSR